ncbi:MAG: TolC family protein, partial [Gemmatimonadaceae bacterium]
MSRVLTTCVLAAVASPGAAFAQSSLPAQLTLDEAVRLAYERNPTLHAAQAGVDVAAADRITAGTRPNPAITFDSVGRPPAARPATPDDHEYLVRLDQEVETAGRRRLRIESAATGVRVATGQAEDVRRRVELEVRKAYFQVVLAKADLDVARTTLAEIDQIITVNQARFTQGEISGGELRRTQVERLRFVDDRLAAELALRNARA